MPITFRIDHTRHLIVAQVTGVFTEDDIRSYVQEMREQNCEGYDELFDLQGVERIEYESSAQVMKIVAQAAKVDSRERRARFAIIVHNDSDFGMSRIYQSYREAVPGSNRDVRVFRSVAEATAWIENR